ncbi:TPA: glycoside hydrolase family protein [Stenotrophomonas maltophilia]|uniref:lysozyme n=1 Tax=Stenotrophomonas maltophilia TaxID=40324 RepID=UPI0002C525A9|nr:glycoside hydrolase family protein [Stenotrophomonas maltophilia]EKT2104872.1 glycoside hydrolase family protein [Stenotrophomonas maltophilia]MBH1617896.1 glycoside hydrolase family protein [Stenotrophomonas maltophilia]QGL75688.1 lysozyme [Stenotrophomonas maltophilia]QGM11056.1 lysozyme [Stenotrophomonas maltophilia]QNG72817.1 hypothetical protein EIELFIGP_01625 [Stenotrophomonas maltophilia]
MAANPNSTAGKPDGKSPGGPLALGSAVLLALLALFESGGSTVTIVYADKLAGGLPTVCDGLTRHVTDTPIIVGEKWSKEKCRVETERAVAKVQRQLMKCFRIEPPQRVFDAASSHAWNLGATATCGSSSMTAWNAGRWDLGCRRLQLSDDGRPVWSYVKAGVAADGKPVYRFVQGLANRRAKERALCEGRA